MSHDAETPQDDSVIEGEESAIAPAPAESKSEEDSATFSRCATCRHSSELNQSAGTLVCGKHNMCINAEADEIPDDCPYHESAESS